MQRLFQTPNFNRLVERLKKGDQGSAAVLYEELFDKVFGFCLNRVSNRALAEDLTQDIFLKLIERVETFDVKKGNFLVWFWHLARNAVIDHYRKHRETQFTDIEETKLDSIGGPVDQSSLDSRLALEKVTAFVNGLSQDDQNLFELYFIGELPYRDIVSVLGKSEGALRVSVSRLRQKLRKEFKNL